MIKSEKIKKIVIFEPCYSKWLCDCATHLEKNAKLHCAFMMTHCILSTINYIFLTIDMLKENFHENLENEVQY